MSDRQVERSGSSSSPASGSPSYRASIPPPGASIFIKHNGTYNNRMPSTCPYICNLCPAGTLRPSMPQQTGTVRVESKHLGCAGGPRSVDECCKGVRPNGRRCKALQISSCHQLCIRKHWAAESRHALLARLAPQNQNKSQALVDWLQHMGGISDRQHIIAGRYLDDTLGTTNEECMLCKVFWAVNLAPSYRCPISISVDVLRRRKGRQGTFQSGRILHDHGAAV